jgi:hypothetical protein
MWEGHRVPRFPCLRNPRSRGTRCPSHTQEGPQAASVVCHIQEGPRKADRPPRMSATFKNPSRRAIWPDTDFGSQWKRLRRGPRARIGSMCFARLSSARLPRLGSVTPPAISAFVWEFRPTRIPECGRGTVCRDSPAFGIPGVAAHGAPPTLKKVPRQPQVSPTSRKVPGKLTDRLGCLPCSRIRLDARSC